MRGGLARFVGILAAAGLLNLALATPSGAGDSLLSVCIPRPAPPSVGLSLLGATRVDGRVTDLRFHSAAMGQDEHVNVMLPSHYDPAGRYQTLYLLHGATGDHRDFVQHGIEAIVGDLPLIVVMPDGGRFGSYSDWYGQTALLGPTGPAPAWETFHIEELIPWIDTHYATAATRAGRAVAGISMGGMGAMKYAARHPDLFAAAGSFSGALDINLGYPAYPLVSQVLWGATLSPDLGPPAYCTWGDPLFQNVLWRNSDPTYLAANLGGVALYLASGNGLAGPLDGPMNFVNSAAGPLAGVMEGAVWNMNESFVQALTAAGIPYTDALNGPGTHTWPYWEKDLTAFVPWVMAHLGRETAPAGFAYRSAEPSFSVWGWSFSSQRRVREFTYLAGVGAGGFSVRGSGHLDVATAALYVPGGRYRVAAGSTSARAQADSDGRLRFGIELAPSHLVQQYLFGPAAVLGFPLTTIAIHADSVADRPG